MTSWTLSRHSKGMTFAAAIVASIALATPSHASLFMIDPAPTVGGVALNLDNAKNVSSFSGLVNTDVVNITTIGHVDAASGNATIKPIKDSLLTTLTFTPVDGNLFNAFSFRGQLLVAGTIDVTVQDNQGHASELFEFVIGKANQDFDRIGIIAAVAGETIKSITISDDRGFKESKQFEFAVASGVPELSTWAMMIIGFGGVGLQMRRRQGSLSLNA